ncbi:YrzI family small protein [Bacillus pseudomycoides]|uniref:YrzI family protein n=1 Tax=Bacillus pseudomycoides TaxID=64104 RepID=A0A2C3ZDQ8_9BACI|nr:YrzI family small protein [Bacillus pseudomycoides]PDY47021.1 YrzI family protein [Bacillus pseudomycoides]PEA82607.1 YrzI family protein [Bacillus pseudomycoides]PED05990.1 YrzI family protein [Bacillus pseudomycoides]PED70923.1 YrzI family protein [Bacillus pseudomycoides]PEI30875.1 YrzI family protein [Bacillus pseudomycoides]
MTFHIFFFTITLQKKSLSKTEILRKQQLKEIMDEVKDRKSSYYNQMY